jgi:dihydrofolate reductase
MATVVADMSMSLDGYVAGPGDDITQVFDWILTGEVNLPTANPGMSFQTDAQNAEIWSEAMDDAGAVITGRRTFDLAGGWGGTHPMGAPVFILTHNPPDGFDDAPFTFVTDGIESAVEQAKAAAGDKVVGVGGASAAQQALNAGLLDAVRFSLVPVLLGDGVPFFANLERAPVWFEAPEVVETGPVTHLYFKRRR